MLSVSYTVKNDEIIQKALRSAAKKVGDLTIPLTLISRDFYKGQTAIFKLKGPGKYPDIKPATKEAKRRMGVGAYPILKLTGRLEKSVTQPTGTESINQIINKNTLIIGSRVPYGRFHQDGTSNIPVRKFLFIGPEAPSFASDEQKGRVERWKRIIEDYVAQVMEQNGLSD